MNETTGPPGKRRAEQLNVTGSSLMKSPRRLLFGRDGHKIIRRYITKTRGVNTNTSDRSTANIPILKIRKFDRPHGFIIGGHFNDLCPKSSWNSASTPISKTPTCRAKPFFHPHGTDSLDNFGMLHGRMITAHRGSCKRKMRLDYTPTQTEGLPYGRP